MVGMFEIAISTLVIFAIVFVWIVIILRRGYIVSNDTLHILEQLKVEASTQNSQGVYEVDSTKLAQLVYDAIIQGKFRP